MPRDEIEKSRRDAFCEEERSKNDRRAKLLREKKVYLNPAAIRR
jgi:hypothetical protein